MKMEINFEQEKQDIIEAKNMGNKLKGSRSRSKNSNKFVGVRQRPSGRWVAEMKDTTKKIRMWCGTFETAEEAAGGYDEAACLVRGSNTRTNFIIRVSLDSPLASSSSSPITSTISTIASSYTNINGKDCYCNGEFVDVTQLYDEAYKPDMRNCNIAKAYSADEFFSVRIFMS